MTMTAPTPRRLYLLQTAMAAIPVGDQLVDWSAGGYLIQMSDGRNVLIDSGPPADVAFPPGMPPVTAAPNMIDQLARLGILPDDISMLVCSHDDIDHVGYQAAFPAAELVVQRSHDAVARNGHARSSISRQHWDRPGTRYRLVDGDTELLPGLTLIETGGHVPGHQSVLVRLPKTGPVLLAIDAVAMQMVFSPDRPPMPWLDEDQPTLVASTQKLIDIVASEGVELVIFHHDGAQWKQLKTAPGYFD